MGDALRLINVGSAPDDSTGEPLRTGLQKVNQNFTDMWTSGPARHRQAILNYPKGALGHPSFFLVSGLSVGLKAGLVLSAMAGISGRSELNMVVRVAADSSGLWTIPAESSGFCLS